MMLHPLNILIRFMPLACNQHNILRLGLGDSLFNRGFAVGFYQRGLWHGGQNVGDDGWGKSVSSLPLKSAVSCGKRDSLAGDCAH